MSMLLEQPPSGLVNVQRLVLTLKTTPDRSWHNPRQFGDGWTIDEQGSACRIIVNAGPCSDEDLRTFIHASISRRNEMPSYNDLVLLHRAVWGDDGWAYQVFAPRAAHVNIHAYALHLWGLPAGEALLPNFGVRGTDWGNPFRVGDPLHYYSKHGTRTLNITAAIAVALFEQHLAQDFGAGIYEQIQRELGGKTLMCYCALGQPCHADVLLAIANHPA